MTKTTKIRAGLYRANVAGQEYLIENIEHVIRDYGHGGSLDTPWRVTNTEGHGASDWVGDFPTKRAAIAAITSN